MAKGPAEIAHGPMFIGYSFNLILYGIMITQVYLYFNTFKKDRLWMKILVIILFIADTMNTLFDALYLYDSLIIHFDDVAYLGNATWVFATDPAMTALIAGAVQLFFSWRVKVLTTNWWLVAIVGLAAITGLVGGLITAYEVGVTPRFVDFRSFKWSVIMWLAGECFGDITITSVLVWHLESIRLVSKHLTNWWIALFGTGFVTALCATLDLVFFLIDPTGTHLIFNFPLAKLYTNSVMSSLNSRGAWNYSTPRSKFGDSNSMPANIITTGDVNVGTRKRGERSSTSPSHIFVQVESHETRDVDVEQNRPYLMPRVNQMLRTGGLSRSGNSNDPAVKEGSLGENDDANSSMTQIIGSPTKLFNPMHSMKKADEDNVAMV